MKTYQDSSSSIKRQLAIISIPILWIGMRWLFWVGYVGSDDLYYAKYAYWFDHPPSNHWETRIPAILAIRSAFLLFGPSELSACLPSLLSSFLLLLAVAFFVNWPKTFDRISYGSVLLVTLMPLDVVAASVPGAPFIASGIVALGTSLFLKAKKSGIIVGVILLAVAFMTHTTLFFYIAPLFLLALFFDWERYRRPTFFCIFLAIFFILMEFSIYYFFTKDLFYGLKRLADHAMTFGGLPADRNGANWFLFFIDPIKRLFFSKWFGFNLFALLSLGFFSWRSLNKTEKPLFFAAIFFWFWGNYGTSVPWAYKPFGAAAHLQVALIFPLCVLLPTVLQHVCKKRVAVFLFSSLLVVNLLSLAGGGRWGQSFDVSRKLFDFTRSHPDKKFLADVRTLNDIYVINHFRYPDNIYCIGDVACKRLSEIDPEIILEPSREGEIFAVLFNKESFSYRGTFHHFDQKEFMEIAERNLGNGLFKISPEFRLLFRAFDKFFIDRKFAYKNVGGEVLLNKAYEPNPVGKINNKNTPLEN